MRSTPKHYVYEWVRPDFGVVFYVGKGTRNRAYCFKRNKHTNDVVNFLRKSSMKPCVRIIAKFVNEDSAYEFEEERIAYWGLENLTNDLPGGRNGGGGMKGKKHKPETCVQIGKSQKGKIISLETRRKLRKINLGKKCAPETCAAMSASRIGRKATEATLTKMSAGIKAAKNTPEGKEKSVTASLESQNRKEVKLKKSFAIMAALRSRPSHWTQKLSERDVYIVGTLAASKEEVAVRYDIPICAVTEIRKIVEEKLGVAARPKKGMAGKKHTHATIGKCKSAMKNNWNSLTEEQRQERGRKMSEGRARAKLLRQLTQENS